MIKPLYTQKASESRFWNEALETMPREQLDALHLERLRGLISYSYKNIPMYRAIYEGAGVRPDDIRTLDDYVRKLPFLDKEDLLEYQAGARNRVGGSEEYRSVLFTTSGTTGRILLLAAYLPDFIDKWVYEWWAHGIRPGDSFYLAFPFGLFAGFWSVYYDALYLYPGVRVISGGGTDSQGRIRQILEFCPTVLVSTPTYALRLAEVAKEMGVDSRATSIRIVISAGESGSVVPGIRRAMEQAWNARAIDLYGVSELLGSTSWQCPLHPDTMHLVESCAHGMVVDGEGRLVPSGEKGEFILTNYEATVQPLIKYRTHDLVEWHKEPCECGRTWLSLKGGVLGRTDQMVTVKGTNVYPSAIQTLLGEIPSLSERMEIHIDQEGSFNRVLVKVEPSAGVEEKSYTGLKRQAEDLLRARIGVGVPVEIVAPMSLPRYEMKAKLVFDHRAKGAH